MPIVNPEQYSATSGFEVVPNPPQLGVNLFQADTEINAKLARDDYFTTNPSELSKYDNNLLRMIQVSWTSPAAVFEFESRVAGQWINTFTQNIEEFQLSTHSVTELSDVTSAGSGQIITNAERSKLAGIQDNATTNQTDSYLLNRVNHTGTQSIATINNLQTTLDSKADLVHSQPIDSVNGLQEELDNKSNINHTHSLTLDGDVTGTAIVGPTGVSMTTVVQDNSHLHIIGNITGLQTTLDGKSATGHTHGLTLSGDVTGSATLGQNTVDLVATVQDNSHNHTIANVTGLQTVLDGKQSKVNGLAVHRFIQVSNAANSTTTANNINTTTILPLLGNGTFNNSFNNPTGYGSLDIANNWIDISNLNNSANLLCRVTLTNNGVGTVSGATLVMRLITDKTNPTVFTDILNVPESFGAQAAFITMAFSGGVDAIQIGIRTTQTENIRLNGVYLVMTDPIVIA